MVKGENSEKKSRIMRGPRKIDAKKESKGPRILKRGKNHWSDREFDTETFERLCAIQCTVKEIVSVMRFNQDTLRKKVREHYDMKLGDAVNHFGAGGVASIKRMQFEKAQEGSDKMLIHLGKHYADQKDEQAITVVQVEQLFQKRSDEEIQAAIDQLNVTPEQIEDISDT